VSIDDGKSTLEAELDKFRRDTLLWSLDGILSYLPVAALYDAKKSQYLLEKFQNVAFTRADADRILRRKTPWKTAIGFGKSTTSEVTCDIPCDHAPCGKKLKSLPLVTQEMAAIFRQAPKARASIKGTIVLNQRFTRQRMLEVRNTPLVHIASHFCFQPGDAAGSFVLLGDDSKFSLNEMSDYTDLYAGVDLLVLSACQTAALERNQFGKEIDSLAELSQRLGAASVIATLWNADEIGASRLMIKFYTLHKLKPEMSKAELLRQAQLSLLKRRETAPNLNLDHPYYWAPFVLYGSFR
jgi:CHAT domain-containing protein